MASLAGPLQHKTGTIQEQASALQYQKINKVPEDIDTLIRQLKQVQDTFRAASKMSNIGAQHFNAKLEQIISELQRASQSMRDIKL